MVRWIKDKHGIWRCPDPRPADHEDHYADALDDVMARLCRQFAARERGTLGVTCHDCGCLLLNDREACPNCLVWAELNAARASWERAVEPYKPSVETVVLEAV